MGKNTTIVIGVGAEQGIGFQTAKKFHLEGHQVYLAGRDRQRLAQHAETLNGHAIELDATNPDAVNAAFAALPSLDCIVHNVGTNIHKNFIDMDAAFFESMWRSNSLTAFNVARAASEKLLAQGRGSIFFTSASAAMRGKPGFAAFAAGRGGNRLMIQALAKELGPKNIHVAQVIVDGIVNGQRAIDRRPGLIEKLGENGSIDPAGIADTFWYLHNQPKSAWTHEMDLRPFKETF